MHMLDNVMEIYDCHAPLSEGQSLLKIADDSNPGHLPAIDTKRSLVFVRSTTDVKNRAHQ
jgi:hypothetical protein